MQKRLIILSDIWGREKSDWVRNYSKYLESNFDITYYDCCELGGIDKSDYTEKKLHNQFVNGGIEKAVSWLVETVKENVTILAFSVGGAIAWKFALVSDKVDSLICVSSTRLRYEMNKPKGRIMLYFGKNDEFKPQYEWFDRLEINYSILDGKDHLFYKEAEFGKELSEKIITNAKTTIFYNS